MSNLPKIIIIHGNHGGTGQDAWIPWLKIELENRGFEVQAPTFPDNEQAKMSVWLPYLARELKADENTILVGWSSGAVAALRFAEQHRLRGSVLIGACHTDLGDEMEKISGYYTAPWNWEAIRNNQDWIAQFASTDDPVIPIDENRFIAQQLQSEYQEFTDKKHFGWPDLMLEFPEVLDAISRRYSSQR